MELFESLHRVPGAFRLGILAIAAVTVASAFGRSFLRLQPEELPPVRFRPRSVRCRRGSLNLLALPLVGSALELLDSKSKNSRQLLVWLFGIEVALGAFIPFLYWWEVVQMRLGPDSSAVLHLRFLSHLLLLFFSMAAFVMDRRFYIVFDEVLFLGTLVGLVTVSAVAQISPPATALSDLVLSRPFQPWFSDQIPHNGAGLIGVTAAIGFWIYAVAFRHRFHFARPIESFRVFVRRCGRVLTDFRSQAFMLGMAVWTVALWLDGGPMWHRYAGALVSYVIAMSTVWLFAAVMSGVFRKRALGFGDVLYVGVVAVFLGWQCALVSFVLAGFVQLVILAVDYLFSRDRDAVEYQAFVPGIAIATFLVVLDAPHATEVALRVLALPRDILQLI